MATSTTSVSICVASPGPLAGSMVTRWPAPFLLTAVTLLDSLKVMPCLPRMRCTVRPTSPSTPGSTRSRNSTTCTSEPSRRHTEPSSSPITPAPMTSMRLGTFGRESAPVEETMVSSSMSMPGSRATSEPVAMTMLLASSVCAPPAASLTSTLPGAAMVAVPCTVSILFFFSRKATPSTLPFTPWSLKASILGRSSLGGGTSMPMAPRLWPASS